MTAAATTQLQTRRYTPDDLLSIDDGQTYELVDGELVERKMGWETSWIAGQLYLLLGAFCRERSLGWVVPADASYECFPDAPGKVRRPDVSFIRFGRLPGERRPQGHCPVAPDLAVEVVSPNELYLDVEEKVAEYLGAGVLLVWVISPPTQAVRVHRADGTVTDLGATNELSGEGVVPGFACRVGDLFRDPIAHPAAKPPAKAP